jgi:hypothetical protein
MKSGKSCDNKPDTAGEIGPYSQAIADAVGPAESVVNLGGLVCASGLSVSQAVRRATFSAVAVSTLCKCVRARPV